LKNVAPDQLPKVKNDLHVVGGRQPNAKHRGLALLEKTLAFRSAPGDAEDGQGANKDVAVKSNPRGRMKARHFLIMGSLLLAVIVPTAATTVYMTAIAADQYHSSASFSVRSIDAAQPSDILGMFSQGSGGSTLSDSYALIEYILSERMVEALDEVFGVDAVFAPIGNDFYYGLSPDLPIEEKLRYWRSMVTVDFDHTSDIMTLEVKAFKPEDSQRIAAFILARSERLVNELSSSARDEILKVAKNEVQIAEQRLSEARISLRLYRDASQEADPIESAKLATQLVATLEQELVQLQAKLSTARTQMDEGSPRIRLMRSEVESLEKQISRERQRFGSGGQVQVRKQGRTSVNGQSDVAGRFQEYETLETDREFAERAYTSALASLEKARIEASGKQRYLAAFIQPTLSQEAQYPARLMNCFLVFLAGLMAWGVGVMGYYNIRDRN
jgi:capsular polysaccharide transport system permease protein